VETPARVVAEPVGRGAATAVVALGLPEDGRIAGGFSRAAKCSTIESGGVLVVFYHPRLEEVRQRVIDLGGGITAAMAVWTSWSTASPAKSR
jgi:predicted enzyme related to lactoylglutathione lyase